jgi:lauroyl/myristoyl acyltransferase
MSSRKSKVLMRKLRRPFEWLGVWIGFAILTRVSHKGLFRLCDFVSAVMYRFDAKGRRHAEANLKVLFGELDPARREKIVRGSYRNMARTVGHAFWTCRDALARVKATGEMSASGRAFLAAHKPAITVSGHIGCWEILSQLAFLEGHVMMSVAKDIGTKGMTDLLMKARMSIGQEIVHADGAFRVLMQGLKDGKSLGLLVDQAVRPSDGGVWIRFFGKPIPVSAAPAFFAAKGKAPLVTAWSRPLKDGRYRCETINFYTPEDARDIWGLTQRIAEDLEGVIRRHPSLWVLNYNAFRKTPTAEDLAKLEAKEKGRSAK